ncbi:LANO_0F13388g1_1 [Lachancea nothofagi CBS 11611]|uniref:LANO_0F13388g1_1 n=1 Tax=Lachancea nothofagi CBS 11611 TaxID=1266666 RepID=A0A1G4KBT0_9SACH|nr:LANO_0F13388g1_1 [Lachancea nothofagi CBS 11611]
MNVGMNGLQACCRRYFFKTSSTASICRRLMSQNSRDPRHVFTDPSNNEILDSKHFFTNPGHALHTDEEVITTTIQQSIRTQRRKRVKHISSAFIVAVLGTIFGYSVAYKVLYLNEESFIPAYPVSKTRNFSHDELKFINTEEIKKIAEYKLLEKLSMHPMIKEEYGVPLHKSPGVPLKSHDFLVWHEDPNPCLAGFLIAPYNCPKDQFKWHTVPFLFKWRIVNRSINFTDFADRLLGRFGLGTSDLFQVVNPDHEIGEYKYERPIQHTKNHRISNVWFMGEMDLGKNDMIVFKGKYHIDVNVRQVDLLRKEGDKLVRYVLYQADEK